MNGNKRKRAKLFAWKYLFLDVARLLAAPSVFLFLRPKWLYETENAKKLVKGAAIVITNHDSFLDPMFAMIALWYRRMRFVATTDLYYHKSLAVFLKRFVTQQFKRDASPDGPKVGTIGLSPRGDWRAPADFSGALA